jgi:hypothetical protein
MFAPGAGTALPRADDDNYEMSDREGDSDEDEEDDDDGRAKKKVPDWARGPALEAAIHAQYGDGGLDPEGIFPEVSTCDLEEIFKAKKKRYAKRTSSGHWLPDRLTHAEKAKYRQDMGYN